jgi:hypothetical protein
MNASLIMGCTMDSAANKLTVKVLGKDLEVEATDCWLRVLQQMPQQDPNFFFHSGYYCWNNRCKTCVFTCIDGVTKKPYTAQSCLSEPKNGDQVIAVPENMGY